MQAGDNWGFFDYLHMLLGVAGSGGLAWLGWLQKLMSDQAREISNQATAIAVLQSQHTDIRALTARIEERFDRIDRRFDEMASNNYSNRNRNTG